MGSSVHGPRRLLMQQQNQQSPPAFNPELSRPGSDLPYLMPATDNNKTQNQQRRPSSSSGGGGATTTTIMTPLNIRIVIVTSALLLLLLAVLALNCAIRCCVRRLFAARLRRSSAAPAAHHHPSTLHKHQLASLPIIIFRINGVDQSACAAAPPPPTHHHNKGGFSCKSIHGKNFKCDEQQLQNGDGLSFVDVNDQMSGSMGCDVDHGLSQNNGSAEEDQMSTDPENRSCCCAICLGEFRAGEALRQLACHHLFHVACVDPWLSRHSASCPICRASPVLPPSPQPPSHSQPLPASIPVPLPSPPLHSQPLSASSSSSSESIVAAAAPVSPPPPEPSIDLPSNSSSAGAPLPSLEAEDPSSASTNPSAASLPPEAPIHSSASHFPLPHHTTAHQLLLALQLHIFMLCNSMPR